MDTLFLSARQAFEGGRVPSPNGDVRIRPKSRDGQTAIAADGTRLMLRVERALQLEVEMTGLQADYGGAVRVQGLLMNVPSGSTHGEESFHETEEGPVILTVLVPGSEKAEKEAKEEGTVGGGVRRGPQEAVVRKEWRVWSAVIVVAFAALIVAVPAATRSMAAARRTAHLNALRMAAQSLVLYASEHEERLAPIDPLRAAGWTKPFDKAVEVVDPGLPVVGARVLLRDQKADEEGRRAVAFADGHVRYLREAIPSLRRAESP